MSKILQTASVNWVFAEDDDQWVVTSNDGKKLHILPKGIEDSKAMRVLEFAREYEELAYEEGYQEAKAIIEKQKDAFIERLTQQIGSLEVMNEHISNELERLMEAE